MKKIWGGLLLLMVFTHTIKGQITVTPSGVVNNYVANICGPGISFSNVTLTGSPNAIALFTNGVSGGLGASMGSGVVMSTGSVLANSLNGPASNQSSLALGTGGIPELNGIAGSTTNDGIILEFDFVPITNVINVNYIFGSEEYNEYVNSGYNDAFAFYISGPGIAGQQNIATVPLTGLPVTINNINVGNTYGCGTGCTNCAYYVDNCNNTHNNIMDGFTAMLTASRTVIPCSTYHIRLMIADGGDSSYDSWVFIQENGLYAVGNPPVSSLASYSYGTSGVEGCANTSVQFSIPSALPTATSINVTWSGTATSGLDYNALPTTITIPAGQTSVSLPITIIDDNINEATETIIGSYNYSVCSTATFTINIIDPPTLTVNAGPDQSVCTGPVNLSALAAGATGAVTYSWSPGGATTSNITVSPASPTTYTVTATDACGHTATDQVVVNITGFPTSTFTMQSPICEGQVSTITYTGSAPAGAQFIWTIPSAGTITSGSGSGPLQVNWSTGGVYNVSLLVVVGSCSSSVTTHQIVVNFNPTISAGNDITLCDNQGFVLSANPPTAGLTTTWTPNLVPGVTTVLPVGVHTYVYTGTVTATGCTASDTMQVTVLPNPVVNAGPDIAVCEGTPVTVNASGAQTYYWPASIQNGVPFTMAPGYYNVVMYGEDVNGCYGMDSLLLYIEATPATPVISSNSPVCVGATLNLSSGAVMGTVHWTGPNGFSATGLNPNIPNVTAAASGTYSAYHVFNGCTSAVATLNVVINPTPAAPVLTSNSPICTGANLNLTSNIPSGIVWTGPNAFSSTAQNPTINNVNSNAAGTYSAYAVALGCTSATTTLNVVVTPTPAAPVISSNSPLCSGATLNLTSDVTTGNVWTGPNAFSSTNQNPTISNVTVAASGTYSAYVVANGCTSGTATTNVLVNPTPAAPQLTVNSPVCSGAALNFTSNAASGNYWTGPNSFSSTVQNPSINGATVAASGTYSAYVVVAGCTSTTSTVNAVVNQTPVTPNITSTTPVCSGATINLTSDVATGNVWTGPNGFSSTIQNPNLANAPVAASGVYSAYVVVNGCTSGTATTNVLVNPTPSAPQLTVNSPICSGAALNFTSNAASGNYWTGPNSFSSTVQNPSINGATVAASGTYSAYVVVAGCTSTTSTVNAVVNQTPVTPNITSTTPVCSGATINLTSDVATGNVWTGPNGFSSTIQNPNVANAPVAASGVYSAYVVVNGCTSGTATTNVLVNPTPSAPQLTVNSPICSGAALNFTSNAASGNYWSGPNSFSSTVQNPSITGATTAASGSYSAFVVALGCTSATTSINAVVNQTPNAPVLGSNAPICSGLNLNLTSNTANGNVWSGPNGFSSAIQNPTINAVTTAASGTYQNYIVQNGCTSTVATHNVLIGTTPAAPVLSSNTPICSGAAIQLNSTEPTGNVWTGPNGFADNTQNPSINNAQVIHAGVYSAYVVVGGCTSATSTTNVVVNPTPTAPVASVNTPICSGATLNFSSDIANGNVWSGPNGFSSTQQNPSIANASIAATGSYSVYAVALGCTSAVSTTNAVVNPTPAIPVLTSNSPICTGQTLNLSSDATSGNVWTGPNGFSSSIQNPSVNTVTLGASGTYSAYVQALGCTSGVGTVNVLINSTPAAPQLSSNAPICEGDALNLNSSANAGNVWSGPNGFSSTLQNPVLNNVTTAESGSYSAYVVASGCTSVTSNLNVTINPIPAAPIISNNGPLCEGELLTLSSNVATVAWSGVNGFNTAVQNPSIANISMNEAGVYSAYNIVLGCSSQIATTTLVVNPMPSNPIASNNGPLCSGATLDIMASNVPNATYFWDGPNSFTSSTQNNQFPNATNALNGVYQVYVVLNGCTSAVSSTSVTVTDLPSSPQISSNGPLCEGQTLQLNTVSLPSLFYQWNGPNGFNSNFASPIINPVTVANAGSYSLYVVAGNCTSTTVNLNLVVNPNSSSVINQSICKGETYSFAGNQYGSTGQYNQLLSNSYGCDSIITLNLTVNPNPEADFSAPVNVSLGNPLMLVYDNSSSATSIMYQFNGGIINQPDWEFTFENEGVYYITQIVSNGNCRDSLTKEVFVNPFTNIFIPNTFTVNEDGINDEFKVVASYLEEFEIRIFDRWGQQVFYSDNVFNGWNGGFQNNIDKLVKQDTYVYKINYKEFKGEKRQLIGHINLIR